VERPLTNLIPGGKTGLDDTILVVGVVKGEPVRVQALVLQPLTKLSMYPFYVG